MDAARGAKDVALLVILGYDPNTHTIVPVLGPSQRWKGLRVVGRDGDAKRFIPEDRLKALTPRWKAKTREILAATEAAKVGEAKRARRKVAAAALAATVAAVASAAALVLVP